MRFWNYNKDWEGTFRGVRLAQIDLDGRPQLLSPGYSDATLVVIRKASGVPEIDDSQTIAVHGPNNGETNTTRQQQQQQHCGDHKQLFTTMPMEQVYDVPHMTPVGLTLKLVLVSTWGDPHYIGLNGCVATNLHNTRVDCVFQCVKKCKPSN